MKLLALIVAALVAVACGSDDVETPTSSSSTPPAPTTITFAGTLDIAGSRFYSFTATSGGTVSVMLASVASQAAGVPVPESLGIGVGLPSGTGCALMQSVSAQSGLNAQLHHTITSGVHCVSVFDEGTMTAPVYFALRFSYP